MVCFPCRRLPALKVTNWYCPRSNKADLAIINRIRAGIKPPSRSDAGHDRDHYPIRHSSSQSQLRHQPSQKQPPPPQPKSKSKSKSKSKTSPPSHPPQPQQPQQEKQTQNPPQKNWRLALNSIRCIVRMQLGARDWAKHDKVRQKLADCYDGMEREERIRVLRDTWRAEVGRKGERGVSLRRGVEGVC